jgi:hypothetical protein
MNGLRQKEIGRCGKMGEGIRNNVMREHCIL